jgi:hypothetical protein
VTIAITSISTCCSLLNRCADGKTATMSAALHVSASGVSHTPTAETCNQPGHCTGGGAHFVEACTQMLYLNVTTKPMTSFRSASDPLQPRMSAHSPQHPMVRTPMQRPTRCPCELSPCQQACRPPDAARPTWQLPAWQRVTHGRIVSPLLDPWATTKLMCAVLAQGSPSPR